MKLPRIYEGSFSYDINKSNDYSLNNKRNIINVNKKINDIFESRNHVYKSKVRLFSKDGIKDKVIVGKNKNYLITMDGELINISNIDDIEKI